MALVYGWGLGIEVLATVLCDPDGCTEFRHLHRVSHHVLYLPFGSFNFSVFSMLEVLDTLRSALLASHLFYHVGYISLM